jgi:DNA invertase Pin-like site-specific DNA recombinase
VRQPKLSKIQSRHLVELNASGSYTSAELAELCRVSRATVYRTIQREPVPPNNPQQPFVGTHTRRL